MKKWLKSMMVALSALAFMVAFPTRGSAQVQPIGERWWQSKDATFVGSVSPLKAHASWLLSEACVGFKCDSLGQVFIANSNGRLVAKGGDSVCINFGGRIPGMTLGLQASNQREYVRAIAGAGQWRCDAPPANGAPAPPPPQPVINFDSLLAKIALLAKGIGTPPAALPNITVKGGDLTVNVGDNGKNAKAAKTKKTREVSGMYLPDGTALGFFGRRDTASYFGSAGYGFGLGVRDFSNGIEALLAIRGDGMFSVPRWSFGHFTPLFGGGGHLASGVVVSQRVFSVEMDVTKTEVITDSQGNVTTVQKNATISVPAEQTTARATTPTGAIFVASGLGWDNKAFLMLQVGYEISANADGKRKEGFTLGAQTGGKKFRVAGGYNFTIKSWGASFGITL